MSFLEVALTGQAPDGGLLMPESIPNVRHKLAQWQSFSYQELAHALMSYFIDDIPPDDLRLLIDKSYAHFDIPEVVRTTEIDTNRYILELFHGPSLAFKDLGLQFVGNLFEYALLAKQQKCLNVLCATSGDTGSAAIEGLRNKEKISVIVLHPHERPSRVQRLQMTTVLDANVHNIALENGTFDDCQGIMKAIFNDLEFKKKYSLGVANSVNWARVLAQIVYYFYAYFRVAKTSEQQVAFATPTGNFGNILAGYIAGKMGLPIAKLVLAANRNDMLSVFFNTGNYQRGKVHKTLSPSMDIQSASNIERYIYSYFDGDHQKVIDFLERFKHQDQAVLNPDKAIPVDPLMTACAITDADTLATIKSIWQQRKYILDPHTAVGVAAATRTTLPKDCPIICLATAHPAKFPEAIQAALQDVAHHARLDALEGRAERFTRLPPSRSAVVSYIEDHCRLG